MLVDIVSRSRLYRYQPPLLQSLHLLLLSLPVPCHPLRLQLLKLLALLLYLAQLLPLPLYLLSYALCLARPLRPHLLHLSLPCIFEVLALVALLRIQKLPPALFFSQKGVSEAVDGLQVESTLLPHCPAHPRFVANHLLLCFIDALQFFSAVGLVAPALELHLTLRFQSFYRQLLPQTMLLLMHLRLYSQLFLLLDVGMGTVCLLLLGDEKLQSVLHHRHFLTHVLQLTHRLVVTPSILGRSVLLRIVINGSVDAGEAVRAHAILLYRVKQNDHSGEKTKSGLVTSNTNSNSLSISNKQQKVESKISWLWVTSCSILPFRKSRQQKFTSKSPQVFSYLRFTPAILPLNFLRNILTLKLTLYGVSFLIEAARQRSAISVAVLNPLPKNMRVLQRRKGRATMTESSLSSTSSPNSLMYPWSARKKAYFMGFLSLRVSRCTQLQRNDGLYASGERNWERMDVLLYLMEDRRGRQAATVEKDPDCMSLLMMRRQLKQMNLRGWQSSTPCRNNSSSCFAVCLLMATQVKLRAKKGEYSPLSHREGQTLLLSQMRSFCLTKPCSCNQSMGRLLQKIVLQKVLFSMCYTYLPNRKCDISLSQPDNGPQHLIKISPYGSAQLREMADSQSFTNNLWKQYWL